MSEAQNQLSPVKRTIFTSANREQRSNVVQERGLPTSNDFVEKHLNVPANWISFVTRATTKDAARVKEALSETECYTAVCGLLNRISNAIHKFLKDSQGDKLIFYDHHSSPLTHHPIGEFKDEPDFVAVKQAIAALSKYTTTLAGNYHKIPWHHAESVGEWKGTTRDGLKQSAVYVGCLNQARPDKPGVYALSASGRDYQVIWSDAGGRPCSELYSWDNLETLVGYVYSLYRPAPNHVTVDSTIVRSPLKAGETHMDAPLWDITFAGKTHTRCKVIFVGEPWTRMTWVARSELKSIIKDAYVSEMRTWREAQLLDVLHKDGYVEGWVQSSASGDVNNGTDTIKTIGDKVARTKTRSVMETRGLAIYACPSVLHFLKVMYDVLEAHRFAVVMRRILHRDISINNILVLPEGIPARPATGARPKFIDEVLDPSKSKDTRSYALIIDLDNGRELLPVPSATQPATDNLIEVMSKAIEEKAKIDLALRGPSGTPLYISRSISYGGFLPFFIRVPLIPTLPADIAANYALVHSRDPYRLRNDVPGQPHGVAPDEDLFNKCIEDEPLSIKYDHYPHHDAESIYWVIVAFLLRALPRHDLNDLDTHKDLHNPALKPEWETFSMHQIGKLTDSRSPLLDTTRKKWEGLLHVKLQRMGRLLRELSEQVAPEYAFSKSQPNEVHLHEAMQRIILKHIWTMTQENVEIPLNRTLLRDVDEIQLICKAPIQRLSYGNSGHSLPKHSVEQYAREERVYRTGSSLSSCKCTISDVEEPSNTADAFQQQATMHYSNMYDTPLRYGYFANEGWIIEYVGEFYPEIKERVVRCEGPEFEKAYSEALNKVLKLVCEDTQLPSLTLHPVWFGSGKRILCWTLPDSYHQLSRTARQQEKLDRLKEVLDIECDPKFHYSIDGGIEPKSLQSCPFLDIQKNMLLATYIANEREQLGKASK